MTQRVAFGFVTRCLKFVLMPATHDAWYEASFHISFKKLLLRAIVLSKEEREKNARLWHIPAFVRPTPTKNSTVSYYPERITATMSSKRPFPVQWSHTETVLCARTGRTTGENVRERSFFFVINGQSLLACPTERYDIQAKLTSLSGSGE